MDFCINYFKQMIELAKPEIKETSQQVKVCCYGCLNYKIVFMKYS